jgi:DNA-binding MarR family transcriptional regulator
MLFAKLRALREFERRHLKQLTTVEDLDLVCEIGFHQEQGQPLSIKQLYLLNLASVATIQRRLRRLRQLGIITPHRSDSDARSVVLTISPKLMKVYARYGEILASNRGREPTA